MRIVCPYEPEVHPLTRAAIEEFAPQTEFVRMGDNPYAYWELINRMWGGPPFIIIEHDIEIHGEVVRKLTHCPRPWCTYPYKGPRHPAGESEQVRFPEALGCVRFSAKLMKDHPTFIQLLGQGNLIPQASHQWRGLDGNIAGGLHILGYQAHVHKPEVEHHHDYPAGCSCGRDH